jgi:hypothetical protein
VIVFSTDNYYVTTVSSDGSFSVSAPKSAPVGMIFAGSDNSFKGYLTLGSDIDSIPLTAIKSGVTNIDLKTLLNSGKVVTPGHNPLGTEIILTSKEKNMVAHANGLFASVVKNPDVDGNGQIDLLEGKFYWAGLIYFVEGGTFSGTTVTPTTPADIAGYKMLLDAKDAILPTTVRFTGPSSSGLACNNGSDTNTYTERSTYFSCMVSSPTVPPAGDYDVTYSGKTFTFSMPDQSGAKDNIVLMVPSVTLNSDNTINKISWIFISADGTTMIAPSLLFNTLEIQIEGTGTPCATYPQTGRLYNSDQIAITPAEHTLKCQNIQWSKVTNINMTYNDLYGNHYVPAYRK